MKLSCALVLTLTNLVIATPFSFSVKGSGASAKAEAATLPFGQFAVVKPVASKSSGFSGSFSKSSSESYASSSASSILGGFNYNAGQVDTASLGYGSSSLPEKGQQATAFATTGSNAEASVNSQATGFYSSKKGNDFSGNANSALNSQYQSEIPENKPSSYVGLSSGVPGHWHENSKPNSFNTNANVPEHSEKVKETFGVQSFSSEEQSGNAFLSTPSTPSQVTVSVEKETSYTGSFGGPPGILNPHDEISSVGANNPNHNVFLSYKPGAHLSLPNKQQSFVQTPVSVINPPYAQTHGPAGNINPTVQSINNDYVYLTQNSKPSYKPEIKPAYLEQDKPTGSSSYDSELKPNNGQYVALQPHTEIAQTSHKELEQVSHSVGQLHSDKSFTNSHESKPIKNIQIFIQPIPGNAPQTSKPVQFTNTQIGSESNKEVKPTNQLYAGGFGAPAGILKPSGQFISSGQTFSSSPVKIEQYESSSIGLTTTGAKETTFNTGFGGSLNGIKPTAQPSLPSINYQSFNSGSSSDYYLTSKPSPAQSVSFGEVSEDVKPTIQSTITNNAFPYSNIPYKPVVTSSPFDITKPNFEVTNHKESSFVSFTTTQPTPVNSWQQSTYKPSFEELSGTSSTPGYFENRETSPTKYPSETGDYTISKQSEKSPSGAYSNVASTPINLQATANLNHQTSNYGSAAATIVAQKPAGQVGFASPTSTSFSQQSSYKPTIENSLATSSASEFSESSKTSTSESLSTSAFNVSKEVYKIPTQIVSNNVYPPGSVASVFHLYPNSEISSQSHSTSNNHQHSTNYGATASFVTQKPTTVNFVGQTPGTAAGQTSSFSQQSNKPTVGSSLTTGSVSGSSVSSYVSSTQKPFYTEAYSVPKETEITPTDTTSNTDYSTVGTAPAFSHNSFSGKPQTQTGVAQQFVEYQPSSTPVTKEQTSSVNLASQTIGSTSALSESTTFSQQSPYKPSVENSLATNSVSGLTEISTPSKNPQYQFPTKPTAETEAQKQPLYANVFGTLTGAVKPSSYSSPSLTGYPGSTSNLWTGPSYVTASNDKPKQTTYFNHIKPTISSFTKQKETLNPTNQPYFTGSTNIASNIPTTGKPSLIVPPLNVEQQGSSIITNQKEKESTTTATSGLGTTYSKPTPQSILNNSGVSYSSFTTSKPTKPINQLSTGNSAFSGFGSSSLSQVKPQYQFSTVQPVTQKKQWYTNTYGTFGAVKPYGHTYPGFTSSFTTFGPGSSAIGGLYDKTKQTTQYTSTGQYKPTSTGQYSQTLTGQYKPTSTGQYKPTYNWGFAGQSGSQKPSNQPTQTGGSFISTYAQTTGKPIVTPSSFDKLKPSSDISQKETGSLSSFASSSGTAKPTNQPLWSEIHESHQTSNPGISSASYVKPTPSEISYESVTGSPLLAADKGKVTSTITSTTPKYDLQKPISATGQPVSHSHTEQHQVVASSQTIVPTKEVEKSEHNHSLKPNWSSTSNQKESSYTSYTGVASSNLNPTSSSVDDSNNSQFVDSQFNEQLGLTNQTPIPDTQKNPSISSKKQSSQPFTPGVIYEANTQFHSNSQVQPTRWPVDLTLNEPKKPEYPSTFGESSVQLTPATQISGSLGVSSGQKELVSTDYYVETKAHSKPTNTPLLATSQSNTVVGTGSATSQSSKTPSTTYVTEVNVSSKPDKVQYSSQTAYKPTSVAGSISSYSDQQDANPTITPTLQETHSNIAGSVTAKPSGQQWVLNTQQTSQQTAFQATKPNIKITVVGKPSSTIVNPPYAGGFGGPSGILKPNEFSISNQGNIQSQYYPNNNNQATSGAYSGAKVGTNSNTVSYTGGFGGPSGVLKPDEKHSTINHSGHDKPSINGLQGGTSQGEAQASYNVVPTSPTSGAEGYIKEQTTYGGQVSAEVQGSAVANAASNASGFANSGAYATSNGFGKPSNSFGGQFGGINGFSTNAKGSATAGATFSGFGGSFTANPTIRRIGAPERIAAAFGRR